MEIIRLTFLSQPKRSFGGFCRKRHPKYHCFKLGDKKNLAQQEITDELAQDKPKGDEAGSFIL